MTRPVLFAVLIMLPAPLASHANEGEGLIKSRPIYVSMLPHFLVNLDDGKGEKFMQIKANTLVANADTERALKLHMPAKVSDEVSYSIGRTSYGKFRVSNCEYYLVDTRSARDMHDVQDREKEGLSMLEATAGLVAAFDAGE